MQSVTGTLAAAITATVRRPLARVLVDWNQDGAFTDTSGDLSANVVSVSVDRGVRTDVEIGAPSGFASAQATVVLAGDLPYGTLLATTLSPYSGAMPGITRIGAPIDIDLGMIAAGAEYVDAFFGKVRAIGIDAGDGAVTITALDREGLRGSVLLPAVVAEEPGASPVRPGLNAGFLVDFILRQCNVFATPPPRASCILSATMFGSAFPEVGRAEKILASYWETTAGISGQCNFSATPSGLPGLGNANSGGVGIASDNFVQYDLAPLTTNDGQHYFCEGFWTLVAVPSTFCLYQALDATALWGTQLFINSARTTLTLSIQRNTGTAATVAITIPALSLNVEHYIAYGLNWTAAGAAWAVRVDGTTYTGAGLVMGSPSGSPTLIQTLQKGTGNHGHIVRGLQVTSESVASPTWNDTFTPTPTTRETSLNRLVATPNTDERDPWVLLQQIAAAEGGIVLVDEAGRFRFFNRDHMTGGASVATVSALTNLTALSASEAIDTVVNRVRVSATPLTFDASTTVIWAATEVIKVPASSSVTIPVQLPGRRYFYVTHSVSASISSDGLGGDAGVSVVVDLPLGSDQGTIVVTNANAFDVWLVDNLTAPSTAGQPRLTLSGSCIRDVEDATGYTAEVSDPTSIATYGEQPLDVPANLFRQSYSAAADYAADLLAAHKDPHAVISGVEIVADPRLQLADRITIVEPDVLGVAADFWVLGIRDDHSTSGLLQSLMVRQA